MMVEKRESIMIAPSAYSEFKYETKYYKPAQTSP